MTPQDGSVGLHHLTAVAGDPRRNLAFYRDVLGLRLVKRTVNFDDPGTYHLYYGDTVGSPGTAMTFFPFEAAQSGQPGRGQPTATTFAVPAGGLDYWRGRLDQHADEYELGVTETTRFGAPVLAFDDPDGQRLELVEADQSGPRPWTADVPDDAAIRGFHSVTLESNRPESTAAVLVALGFVEAESETTDDGVERRRFEASGDSASTIDLLDDPSTPQGRPGIGTIHHVAVRARDDDHQAALRDAATDIGMQVTPQKDRRYFRSMYFREPGGILLEIATDEPGFTRDEDEDELGESLTLPPWLEDRRADIEGHLPPLDVEAAR